MLKLHIELGQVTQFHESIPLPVHPSLGTVYRDVKSVLLRHAPYVRCRVSASQAVASGALIKAL